MGKKLQIKGLDAALKAIPEEHRDEARTAILSAFENFDPENPPGQRVLQVPKGTRVCPNCGGPLDEGAVIGGQESHVPDHPRQLLLDCPACDQTFSEEAESS